MKTENKQKYRQILTLLLVLILILILGVAGSVVLLRNYVQHSIHDERKIYLDAQTETTRNLIDQILSEKMEYARICRRVVEKDGLNAEDLNIDEFIDDLQTQLYMKNVDLILVDDRTIWYGKDGAQGRISSSEYYGNHSDAELMYIGTDTNSGVESIIFRQRLQRPVNLKKGEETLRIEYCAAVYAMEDLQEQVSIAFPYECNSFILDENGLMLYRLFGITRLIDGSNVFAKYDKVEFKYGDTGTSQMESIRSGATTVGEFTIPSGDFFICTAALSYNNWYVSFVLPSDSLAAGSYIGGMFLYVSLISLFFVIGSIIAILLMIRSREGSKLLALEREANAHLEKAAAAKGEFLSNMSHDIRTPINGIIGMTAIAGKEDNPQRTVECLDKIEISSRYLLSLVNDVLDMSSIESGKFKIAPAPLHLHSFLDDCMVIIHGQTQNRSLTMVPEFDRVAEGFVLADELRLRQIFINILSNAVKFTPDGGTIWFRAVQTSATGEHAQFRFEIEDTGCGMSEEFLATIWDRFSQEGNTARSKYQGTGLGMAITRKLVELMDGTIEVESELGKGTTFIVKLGFDCCEAVEEKEEEAEEGGSIEGVRILLAEDNDINREIAVELLQDQGAVVEEALDGKEALDKFAASEAGYYDLILMDIMMPVMNGKESSVAIRKLDRPDAASIPIVAMTANVMEADMKSAMAAGMNGYLTKPIDMKKVISTIASLTEKKKQDSTETERNKGK